MFVGEADEEREAEEGDDALQGEDDAHCQEVRPALQVTALQVTAHVAYGRAALANQGTAADEQQQRFEFGLPCAACVAPDASAASVPLGRQLGCLARSRGST